MPRRPSTRRRALSKNHRPPPATFSSFSRSVAHMSSSSRRRPAPEPLQNPKSAGTPVSPKANIFSFFISVIKSVFLILGKDLVDSDVESSDSSDEEEIVDVSIKKKYYCLFGSFNFALKIASV